MKSLEWIQCILRQSGYLAPFPNGSLKIYTSSISEEPLKGKRHWRRYLGRQSPLFLVLLQLPDGDIIFVVPFPQFSRFGFCLGNLVRLVVPFVFEIFKSHLVVKGDSCVTSQQTEAGILHRVEGILHIVIQRKRMALNTSGLNATRGVVFPNASRRLCWRMATVGNSPSGPSL